MYSLTSLQGENPKEAHFLQTTTISPPIIKPTTNSPVKSPVSILQTNPLAITPTKKKKSKFPTNNTPLSLERSPRKELWVYYRKMTFKSIGATHIGVRPRI